MSEVNRLLDVANRLDEARESLPRLGSLDDLIDDLSGDVWGAIGCLDKPYGHTLFTESGNGYSWAVYRIGISAWLQLDAGEFSKIDHDWRLLRHQRQLRADEIYWAIVDYVRRTTPLRIGPARGRGAIPFIQACLDAEPGNLAPATIFADWLEEEGLSEVGRKRRPDGLADQLRRRLKFLKRYAAHWKRYPVPPGLLAPVPPFEFVESSLHSEVSRQVWYLSASADLIERDRFPHLPGCVNRDAFRAFPADTLRIDRCDSGPAETMLRFSFRPTGWSAALNPATGELELLINFHGDRIYPEIDFDELGLGPMVFEWIGSEVVPSGWRVTGEDQLVPEGDPD